MYKSAKQGVGLTNKCYQVAGSRTNVPVDKFAQAASGTLTNNNKLPGTLLQ
jgi:hypothetical protein